jgi:hypothetical protein
VKIVLDLSGSNPTIVIYNARAAKIYNATSSLVRFENKNSFFYLENNALAYYSAGVVVVNSGVNPTTFEFTATTPARAFLCRRKIILTLKTR